MKEFVLNRSFWMLDLIVCVCTGACVARVMRADADSEGTHPEMVLLSTFIGGFSYVLAYLIACPFRNWVTRVRSWVWLGVGGSIINAIGNGVIVFSLMGWHPNLSLSVSDYLWQLVPYMMGNVVVGMMLFSVLTVSVIMPVRTIAYPITVFFNWMMKTPLK